MRIVLITGEEVGINFPDNFQNLQSMVTTQPQEDLAILGHKKPYVKLSEVNLGATQKLHLDNKEGGP